MQDEGSQDATAGHHFRPLSVCRSPPSCPCRPEQEARGPWTAEAERTNGRAAVVGCVALVLTEVAKGGALLVHT